MGRGPKPTKGQAKPAISRESQDDSKVRDLEKRLAEASKREAVVLGQLQTRDRELVEAQEQQTATSEILRVISQSQTDVQPVFETMAANALRLCHAELSAVFRFDGELIHLVALNQFSPEGAAALRDAFPMRPGKGGNTARAIVTRGIAHIPDLLKDPEYVLQGLAQRANYRSNLSVPMLRDGHPIGAITVAKAEPGPFPDNQIELLKTFADEAVIAIENVRLFNETKEALEQQTATSEILRVIASSPTDVRPVFEAILKRAATLCEAQLGHLWLYEGGEQFRLGAGYGSRPDHLQWLQQGLHRFGRPFFRESGPWRVGQVLDVRDTEPYRRGEPVWIRTADHEGMRTLLAVPLVKDGRLVGSIAVYRREVQPFTDQQTALVQTFADQAVIAIENVRLFTELQEKNKALTEAHAQVTESLEQQTATGEILRVISGSPTDVQPVFDAIVRAAVRLCDGFFGVLTRYDGRLVTLVAAHNIPSEVLQQVAAIFPGPPNPDTITGRVLLSRAVVHEHDVRHSQLSSAATVGTASGYRTIVGAPMLRDGEPIGTISVARREVEPFSVSEIALLQTFADQAVIAIENVRLFKELQTRNTDLTDALSRQTATSEILRVISGSPTDVQPVFDTIVKSAVTLCNGVFGGLDRFDGDLIYSVATHNYTPEALDAMHRIFPARPSRSLGVGRAILDRDVVHIPDVELDPEYRAHHLAGAIGFRSGLFVPMLRDGVPIGAILVARAEAGPFSDNEIALLKTFADQAVIAIENVRLFHELEAANRELSAASQHKSEFLANMSHELRTPLNAIIGFSEVLSERMFGELNEKQEEYSKDIHASGQHLLSLINDILDLSKIEAGRMELELSDFHLPTALDSALTLVRERAGRRSLTVHTNIDRQLGEIRADERKIRQVVLNLLSNAIKFTPEGGRIDVAAVSKDGLAEVSISDTGVGIAPEDQEAVFEEFRQVGTADKKGEGTGLGLTLCRKFVELHGGRIRVKSELGVGSTFTFTIPVRCGE
jgi:two-component system, NtrC family, sensor kinase